MFLSCIFCLNQTKDCLIKYSLMETLSNIYLVELQIIIMYIDCDIEVNPGNSKQHIFSGTADNYYVHRL